MRLYYNLFALHDLGELTISQSSTFQGGDPPQAEHVTLRATVDMFSTTPAYGAMMGQYQNLRDVLSTPHAALRWENEATGQTYVSQSASVVGHDLPEDPTGWGSYHFRLTVTFTFIKLLTGVNQVATISSTAGSISLDRVIGWSEELRPERWSDTQPGRRRVMVRIAARGMIMADPLQDLATRRAWLLAQKSALEAVAASSQATLTFGDFNATVRVSPFQADVDQAVNAVNWSFTAEYQQSPGEADFAIAEATAAEADHHDGSMRLQIGGSVTASTEDAARVKWALTTAALIAQYGYSTTQPILDETNARSGIGLDGSTFIRLDGTKEVRGWRTDNPTVNWSPSGSSMVDLGNLSGWTDRANVERADALHPHRMQVARQVGLSGTICHPAPQTTDTTSRRSWLSAKRDELMASFGAASQGTITVGPWTQQGKLSEYGADLDSGQYIVTWHLTINWVEIPGAADTVGSYTASETDAQTGDLRLVLTGKVVGSDSTLLSPKLASMREAALASLGYSNAQAVSVESTKANISVPDGDALTELSFHEEYRRWRSDNMGLTFTDSGSGGSVNLGQVQFLSDDYSSNRFSEYHGHRRRVAGQISARGLYYGDRSLSDAARRQSLLDQLPAFRSALSGKEGQLVYGSALNLTVRVDRFKAEINQSIAAIDWSLDASYTKFPNEANFATVELTVTPRQGNEDGEERLSMSGRILAPDETTARAKWTSVMAAVLTDRGYSASQCLDQSSSVQSVDANDDGVTFTELTVSAEFRRRLATVDSSVLRTNRRYDVKSGLVAISYNGHVQAIGGDADAAYAAALVRAAALGDNKYPYKVGQTLNWDERTLTGNREGVRLEFTYEYLTKDGVDVYLDLSTETNQDNFGVWTESASGTIAAADLATAQAVYVARVRSIYADRLVRGERISQAKSQIGTAPVELPGLYSFSLSAVTRRTSGQVAVRYSIETDEDNLENVRSTKVSGACWASSESEATTFIDTLLGALNLGDPLRRRRSVSHEQTATASETLQVDFDQSWSTVMSGVTGILECDFSVSLQYSGTRWVKQDLPFATDGSGGVAVMQGCGIDAGARQVRGRAKAADANTALAWCMDKRTLLTGDVPAPGYTPGFYPSPPRIETTFAYLPRNGTDVRVYQVSFEFGEVLPWYPLV